MYDLVERSLVESGIIEQYRDELVDRGDGILTVIHPVDEIPKTLLLNKLVPTLRTLLGQHVADHPEQQLELRVVLHAGEVHRDSRGYFGETLDVAFRLLDAPEVKQLFRRISEPLLLVISDAIYTSIVRHGYDGIDEHGFTPVTKVEVGGQQHRGWAAAVERGAKFGRDIVIDVRSRRVQRAKRLRRVELPTPHEQVG